ncbi:MAG: hypothetical protein ACPGR5_00775 [Chitinophagales bacterium]
MKEILAQISKSFELKDELIAKVDNEEKLIHLLSLYIQELINTDFEHLLYLLYKIDVGEKKVKEAIMNSKPEEAHIIIAKMILKREKEKVETRKKYKVNKENTDWIF